jgi:Zn-finger nucleic acid-binding protein
MICPSCQAEVQTKLIENVEVDECRSCKGIWFDRDELRKVKDQTEEDLQWMDFDIWKKQDLFRVYSKAAKCPECNVNMATIEYGETGVGIESCARCQGVWLDAGELQKIVDDLSTELNTMSASEYLSVSLEEAREIITGQESFMSEWKDFLAVVRLLYYRLLVENPKVQEALLNIQKGSPIR